MNPILELTATSPVQSYSEPLSLAEVKEYLKISDPSPVDSEFDNELNDFIQGAREQAEMFQGRDLVQKQWDLSLDCFPYCEIELRRPLLTVDLVRYRNSDGTYTTLVEGTDYVVDYAHGWITPVYGGQWPRPSYWPSAAVLVRFTAGVLNRVPQLVKLGMLMLIADWFNNRLPFGTGADAGAGYSLRLRTALSYGAKEGLA